jgi:alginate O-acetyltransferase complex protein AlgI
MLFNSFQFLLFFPIVTVIYFLLPHKLRWAHLLISSCLFYMAFIPVYILILFFTIIIDYGAGIMIEKAQGRKRKIFLLLSVIANVGVLCIFKYYDFFVGNIDDILNVFHVKSVHIPLLNIILPLGLSFHTFQAMSYTIEVYRGNQQSERHLGIYALYVMFFPQLVAGPIERPQHMLHQFHEVKSFEFENAISGFEQVLWGFFKKLAVGDVLAIYVNSIYDHYEYSSGLTLIAGTFAFAFQVYCDFSAYSDIAQGTARIMGYKLMTNFNFPFSSTSISELWRRWHISLSSWVNDYLYTPLAIKFREYGVIGVMIAAIISFALMGLWHGANWNFVIYGVLNGLYICYEVITRKTRKKISKQMPGLIYNNISKALTFIFFSGSLIFFRSRDFIQAITVVKNIFTSGYFWGFKIIDTGVFASMIFTLTIMILWEKLYFKRRGEEKREFKWVRSLAYSSFFLLIIILFGFSKGAQFIYFRF